MRKTEKQKMSKRTIKQAQQYNIGTLFPNSPRTLAPGEKDAT